MGTAVHPELVLVGLDPAFEPALQRMGAELSSAADTLAALVADPPPGEETVLFDEQLVPLDRFDHALDFVGEACPQLLTACTAQMALHVSVDDAGRRTDRVTATVFSDDEVIQVGVHRSPDGSWVPVAVRALLSACVVIDSGGTSIGTVLLASQQVPLLARLRWSVVDRAARGKVAAWHGDDDVLRGPVYRAQLACRLTGSSPYPDTETAGAELAAIMSCPTFQARWPGVDLPAVTDAAPAGTRAVTVFVDDRAVEIALAVGLAGRDTLLHELAHVVTPYAAEAHDESFVAAFLELLERYDEPGVSGRMRVALAAEGVCLEPAAA